MSWQVTIEINRNKSKQSDDHIIELGQKTASLIIISDPKLTLIYDQNRTTDLDVMLEKLWGWKSATYFLNGHTFRPAFLRMTLNCYNYGSLSDKYIGQVCSLCPTFKNCEKAISFKINNVFKNKIENYQ